MKYPILSELPTSREMLDVFRGYNHNLRISDGEFYEMTNLSSDNYPVLSPRAKRGVYEALSIPQGMIAKDALCYVDGGDFIINKYNVSERVALGLTIDTDEDGKVIPKTLISMGAYVIIMPDKKYINTENYADNGKIEAKVVTSASTTFELCTVDGVAYANTKVQPMPPVITAAMEKGEEDIPLWIDTSETPHQLKQYSLTSVAQQPDCG